MKKHPKYRVAIVTCSENLQVWERDRKIRAKCKGGLAWASTCTDKHIHFLLDGLNMRDVVAKSNKIGGSPDEPVGPAGAAFPQADKVRTITNAELRWVFRHRREVAVSSHVQFWFAGLPCPPPWEHPVWCHLWRDYHPANAPAMSTEEEPLRVGLLGRLFAHRFFAYNTRADSAKPLWVERAESRMRNG